MADFGGAPVQLIVDRAVSALSSMLTVRKEVLEPVIHATKRFELSLYRNQVMHLFLGETIVCAAMYATIKKGQTQRRLTREMLLRNVVFISQLLKVEFIFKPGSVEENLNDAVRTLVNHRILSVEDEQGKPYGQQPVASAGDVPADIIIDELPATYFVKLSDVERTIGRENYDFYCFLIWPFIETYWLAAVSLFSLIPTPPAGGISEKTLMDRVQFFGKTLYYEGDLGYFESVNKETIKNAFKRYQDIGFLITKTVYGNEAQDKQSSSSASQSSTVGTQQQSQQLSKFATKLYAIHPSYEAEVLPFIDQPLPNKGTPYRTAYKFNRNSDLSREFTLSDSLGQNTINGSSGNSRQPADIYSTRLWMFAEEIGKFRREGKHRRDNEVTGKRTLRLARMARAVGNSNGTANSRI